MKKIILIMGLIALALSAQESLGADLEVSGRTGCHLDWWDGDDGDEGTQFFIPIRIDGQYGKYSARLLTAYAYTDVEASGGQDSSLSNIVDTKLNFSYDMPGYNILGKFPVDVLFGLDFNLPTGETDFDEGDLLLSLDPDLASITSLGEGFNVNPTVTLAKQWDKYTAGLGLGYVRRGEYDVSSATKDYDPGNILNLATQLAYDYSPEWRGHLSLDYARYGTDEVDGDDYYEEGDFWAIGFGVHHFREMWDAGLTVQGIFRDEGEFHAAAAPPTIEDEKNRGDEWIVRVAGRYFWDDKTTVKASLEFLRLDENDYPSDSPFYFGERKKISVGFGMSKTLALDLEGELSVKFFVMDDDKNWLHPEGGEDFKGFSIGVMVTKKF